MKPSFLITLFIYCCFPIFAQNRSIDSLNLLLAKTKENNEKLILQCKISQAHTEIGNFSKGGEIADKALKLAKELGDKKGEGLAYYSLARLNQYMRQWDDALIYHYQAIQLFDETNAIEELAWSYLNMGIAFDAKKEFDRAIRYETKALESFKKIKHKKGEAYSYLNLGSTLFGKKNLDEAFIKLEKAKIICESINDQTGIGYVYNIRGDIYLKEGKFQEALNENTSCLSIRLKENNKRDIAFLNSQNAKIYFLQNKLKEALSVLELAEKAGLDVEANFALKDIYLTWSKIDSAQGNQKSAYHHFKEYNKCEKIISDEDQEMEVKALKYAFTKQLKETKEESAVSFAECEKTMLEVKNDSSVFKSILATLSVAIFSFLIFRIYRKRKQN